MSSRVAVVTGGNKGIGFCIVKFLCQKFDGDVYLTARDEKRGNAAVAELNKMLLHPKFHQLDIDDLESIRKFRDHLKQNYEGLDVLVNNAGIAYKHNSTAPFAEQAEVTVKTNFFSTLSVCKELFPLLRPHARVVNVSSMCGMLKVIPGQELRDKLNNPNITLEELVELMKKFVHYNSYKWSSCKKNVPNKHRDEDRLKQDSRHTQLSLLKKLNKKTDIIGQRKRDSKDGVNVKNGWGQSAYNVSKVGVTVLSFIQQREFDKDSRSDLVVNAVHPGYVDTDMTSHRGPLTPDQGADAPTYLALLPPNVKSPRGEFVWNDRKVVPWNGD